VGFVSSIAEDMGKCSLVRVHGDFREEKDVRGVKIYRGGHIRQRGAAVSRFFGVYCENVYLCRGRGCRSWRACVSVDPRWRSVWGI
jgi:hypothetical protein